MQQPEEQSVSILTPRGQSVANSQSASQPLLVALKSQLEAVRAELEHFWPASVPQARQRQLEQWRRRCPIPVAELFSKSPQHKANHKLEAQAATSLHSFIKISISRPKHRHLSESLEDARREAGQHVEPSAHAQHKGVDKHEQ